MHHTLKMLARRHKISMVRATIPAEGAQPIASRGRPVNDRLRDCVRESHR